MSVDPAAILSQVSGLLGALIGGGASPAVAVYNQRAVERLQRVANEIAKRETVYADFLESASTLLLTAFTHLLGLINRMRLFASPDIVGGADAVLKGHRRGHVETQCRAAPACAGGLVQKSRTRSLPAVQPDLPLTSTMCVAP
jgi:hypothetical protein